MSGYITFLLKAASLSNLIVGPRLIEEGMVKLIIRDGVNKLA